MARNWARWQSSRAQPRKDVYNFSSPQGHLKTYSVRCTEGQELQSRWSVCAKEKRPFKRRTCSKDAQSKFYNEQEYTASRRQTQNFGYESLVQSSKSFLAGDGQQSGVCPVVFWHDAGYLFCSLNSWFDDLTNRWVVVVRLVRWEVYHFSYIESDSQSRNW